MRKISSLNYLFLFFILVSISFAANCGGSTPCNCGDTIIQDYVMTSDLPCSGTALTIGADHITLDCQGYTITHTGSGYGVYADGRTNITIKNCNIVGDTNTYNNHGIYFYSTSNSFILNNNLSSNYYGIYLYSSSNNTLSNITASNNYGNGIYLYSSSNNSLFDITASNNNDGIWLESNSNYNTLFDITASNNNNGIYLYSSSNNSLFDITASNNYDRGIYLYFNSNYNSISNITASNNNNGIYLYSSSNNSLSNITSSNNQQCGIYLSASSYNNISKILAYDNVYGLYIDSDPQYESNYNYVFDSLFSTSDYGIRLYNSNNNIIFNNEVNSIYIVGIDLWYSNNNNISNNNIFENNYYSINFHDSYYNLISNNNISTSLGAIGIEFESDSSNNTIVNNFINGSFDWKGAIHFYFSNENNVSNNTILISSGNGITLEQESMNIRIFNNSISTNENGIYIKDSSDNSEVFNNSILAGGSLFIFNSNSNFIFNNDLISIQAPGLGLYTSFNNIISSNKIKTLSSEPTNYFGIYIHDSQSNEIYNNIINGSIPVHFEGDVYENFWNTTLDCSAGPNIVGGPCIAGNFYATPSGTGFSETCTDNDGNGICDEAYELATNNIDFLPLAVYTAPS
ncbi:MAG: NosD domain-containing protein, partial [Candidatus Micrarchaeia archaeon]